MNKVDRIREIIKSHKMALLSDADLFLVLSEIDKAKTLEKAIFNIFYEPGNHGVTCGFGGTGLDIHALKPLCCDCWIAHLWPLISDSKNLKGFLDERYMNGRKETITC